MPTTKQSALSTLAEVAADVAGFSDDIWAAIEQADLAGVALPKSLVMRSREVLGRCKGELQALAEALEDRVEPAAAPAPSRHAPDSPSRRRFA